MTIVFSGHTKFVEIDTIASFYHIFLASKLISTTVLSIEIVITQFKLDILN